MKATSRNARIGPEQLAKKWRISVEKLSLIWDNLSILSSKDSGQTFQYYGINDFLEDGSQTLFLVE